MATLHFCSRKRGWMTDDTQLMYRYYCSPSIELSHEAAARWTGRTGAQIIAGDAPPPEALRRLASIFDTWYLYPVGTSLGCGPEHYA